VIFGVASPHCYKSASLLKTAIFPPSQASGDPPSRKAVSGVRTLILHPFPHHAGAGGAIEKTDYHIPQKFPLFDCPPAPLSVITRQAPSWA
jgi:hypothetical protein